MQEWEKAAKRLGWYGYFPKNAAKWYGRRQRRPYNCEPDVEATQSAWRQAILDISAEYLADPQGSQYIERAEDAINELYAYGIAKVMFKPTLAVQDPFRPTFIGALSYFVGYEATQDRGGVEEDKGFAVAGGDTRRSSLKTIRPVAWGMSHFPRATTTERTRLMGAGLASSTASCTRRFRAS